MRAMAANLALHDGERLELFLDDRAVIWHDSTNTQQVFYSGASLRRARQTEYPRSTVHAWYPYLYLYLHLYRCVHTIYSRTRNKSWLVLYMAPYSEWMGCGSGITKNCEWLKPPNKKRKQIPTSKNNVCTANEEKKKKFTARKKKKICHANDAIQNSDCADTVICPIACKNRARTIAKRLQHPPVHAAVAGIRRKCALLVGARAASSGTEPAGANRGYTVLGEENRQMEVCRQHGIRAKLSREMACLLFFFFLSRLCCPALMAFYYQWPARGGGLNRKGEGLSMDKSRYGMPITMK